MKIQVYSVEQAAEILGAKPSTIRTYCREGKIPALKIGRSYRIAEEDLKRWLRSQKRDSGFLEDEDQRAKEAEKKYKDLFENANDAILLINRRGRMTLANPKARELFGYTTEQVEGLHFARLVYPEDLPVVTERFMARMAGEDVPSRYEVRCISSDGRIIPLEINSSVILEEGMPTGVQVVMRDISERLKAERELKKFKFISDNSNDAHFLVDENGRFRYVNKVACEKMGYSEEELLGLGVTDVDIVFDENKYRKLFNQLQKERVPPFETVNKRKNGEIFASEISSTGIELDGKPYMFADLRDIDDRKEVERALRQSEERFKQVAENAREWIWEVDKNGLYTYSNPVVEKILGLKPREIVGKKYFFDFFHPAEGEFLKKEAFAIFKEERPFREFANRNVHKNGKTIWLLTSGSPFFDEKGKLLGYRGLDVDISERKQAEDEIKRSEEKFSNIFKNIHEGLLHLQKNGKILDANKQAVWIFGGRKKDLVGKNFTDLGLIDSEHVAMLREEFNNAFKGQNSIVNISIKNKEGRMLDLECRACLVNRDDPSAGVIALIHDMTEYKRVYEELRINKDRLRAQYDNMPIPTYTWRKAGEDFILVDYNKAALKITGGGIKEYRGMALKNMYPDQSEIPDDINRCYVERRSINKEMLYWYKTTSEAKFLAVSYVFIPPDLVLVHTEDITERKKAETRLRELEEIHSALLKMTPCSTILTDSEGNITYVSRQTSALHGFAGTSELIGANFLSLLAPKEHKQVEKNLQKAVREHQTLSTPCLLAKKDGTYFGGIIQMTALGDQDGEAKGFVVVTRQQEDRIPS